MNDLIQIFLMLVIIVQIKLATQSTRQKKPDFLTILGNEIDLESFVSEDLRQYTHEQGFNALLSVQSKLKKSLTKYQSNDITK